MGALAARLVDRLERLGEDGRLLLGARRLVEPAPVDENAQVGDALLLKVCPMGLEGVDDEPVGSVAAGSRRCGRLERAALSLGGGAAGSGALERHAVGVGVLLGPPVVRERDGGQRLPGLGLGVDLAQLLHRDQGLGRQLVAALGQPAAALLLHPRAAQDEGGLAIERAQGLPERLGVGVLGPELCQIAGRQLAHAGDLGADGLLRVRRRAGRKLDWHRFGRLGLRRWRFGQLDSTRVRT